VLQEVPSPAARLEIEVSNGRSVLTLHGEAGRTYVIEQLPELFGTPPFNRMWWYTGDVTLTNSLQTFVDPWADSTVGRTFYRATLIE
jgi:hypothetical protein